MRTEVCRELSEFTTTALTVMSSSQSFVGQWARRLGLTREQFEVAGIVTFYMVAALTVRLFGCW